MPLTSLLLLSAALHWSWLLVNPALPPKVERKGRKGRAEELAEAGKRRKSLTGGQSARCVDVARRVAREEYWWKMLFFWRNNRAGAGVGWDKCIQ